MGTLNKLTSLLLISFLVVGCGTSETTTEETDNSSNDSAVALKTAASDAVLEAQIKASLLNNYGSIDNNYPVYAVDSVTLSTPAPLLTPTPTDVAESSATSTTNTQESTVDEADRLKTDGNYLYVSSIDQPSISIFKAETGAAPLVKKYGLTTLNSAPLSGFYLRDAKDQLLAITGDGATPYPVWDMWFTPYYWQNRKTELFYLDISDPEAPTQQAKLSIDGQLISSRRIGSYLYLATRHTPMPDGLMEYPTSQAAAAVNKSIIDNASLADFLPNYSINNGEELSLFDSGDCFLSDYANPNDRQSSIISVVAINLDAASPQPEAKCFMGDAETLYVSEKALYLATTGHQYDIDNGVSVYNSVPTTEIHKFSLNGTETDYKGSSSVAGHLGWQQDLKPFRMSEHNDVLRIITYTGSRQDSESSPAHLYTLEEDATNNALKVIGELPNAERPDPLGKPGEQIYASRFIGNKGYLVTFRMTDPLYIIDLSDPSDPYIASALEVDGYSDYLHPVGENYLLGIGKDAKADEQTENVNGDGRGAWYQGVKLSLIDISNPSAPFEKEKIIIGGRGSETAVSRSHHALTTLKTGNTLKMALPVSLHETESTSPSYAIDDPRYSYEWTRDELYRLNINTLTGEISVLSGITAESNDSGINYYTQWEQDRSVMIGDEVYYLHKDEVRTTADITE